MLTLMEILPENVLGIKATGEVNKEDFDEVLLPAFKEYTKKHDKINYLLLLETDVKKFTAGAWLKDFEVGIKNLTKWNKIAVVTDQEGVEKFSDIFGFVVPGDSKGFPLSQLKEAIEWVSAG